MGVWRGSNQTSYMRISTDQVGPWKLRRNSVHNEPPPAPPNEMLLQLADGLPGFAICCHMCCLSLCQRSSPVRCFLTNLIISATASPALFCPSADPWAEHMAGSTLQRFHWFRLPSPTATLTASTTSCPLNLRDQIGTAWVRPLH